jgi:hypothetical protein
LADFSLPWSAEIITTVLGMQYTAAVMPMKITFVYSLWQSVGAINLNMLYALELTTSRTVIGIFLALMSLPLTYLVLAPNNISFPGMNLGASGLALNMVLLNAVTVNVYSWWIARKMNWKFHWCSQFITASTCFVLGYLWYYLLNNFVFDGMNSLIAMGISALGYLLMIGMIGLKFPFFLRVNCRDVNVVKNLIIRFWNQKSLRISFYTGIVVKTYPIEA